MNEKEQLQEQFKTFGAQLGMLLELADIPQEEKDSWVAIAEEMNAAQFDKLAKYLTSVVPEHHKKELRDFMDGVARAEFDHEKRVEKAGDAALEELAALEKDLNLE